MEVVTNNNKRNINKCNILTLQILSSYYNNITYLRLIYQCS